MDAFELYNPVRVAFGPGQIARLGELLPRDARILLTYGRGSIRRNGVYDAVIKALGGHHVVEFGGIEPNPRYEMLLGALPLIEAESLNFILAVGGGSVIDGSKFIAAAARYDGDDKWAMVSQGKGHDITRALPLGVVLTLAATGSEMNRGAVITREQTHEKLSFHSDHMYPIFSVVDPDITLSLPPRQVVNGVIDAFIHVMEQYMTYPVGAMIQDQFAEGILRTLLELGPRVRANPQDRELRANLSMAAMVALNGWIRCGVPEDWATHKIGHELTGLYGIDHARTLAAIFVPLLEDQFEHKSAKLSQCAQRVFGLTQGTPTDQARACIAKIHSFLEEMLEGQVGLRHYGLGEAELQPIWERIAQRGWRLGERGAIDAQAVARILKASI